jgi:hypothetical protein
MYGLAIATDWSLYWDFGDEGQGGTGPQLVKRQEETRWWLSCDQFQGKL